MSYASVSEDILTCTSFFFFLSVRCNLKSFQICSVHLSAVKQIIVPGCQMSQLVQHAVSRNSPHSL